MKKIINEPAAYFQSPSPEQVCNIAKEVEAGAGVLYLYRNYTGDIMIFDIAAELCEMDDIECGNIVGADDNFSIGTYVSLAAFSRKLYKDCREFGFEPFGVSYI